MARKGLAVLTLVVLVAGAGVGAETGIVDEGWRELTTEHLTVVTDGTEAAGSHLVYLLEALRATLSELALRGDAPSHLPTTVVAFADADSYAPFRLHRRSGQFFSTPFENLIVVESGVRQRPVGIIAAHEYVHAFVLDSGQRLPLWLNEGLAEYFSTMHYSKVQYSANVQYSAMDHAAQDVVLGEAPRGHRGRLRGHAFIPFEQFFAMQPMSKDYLDHEKASRFYAQSWLLVHYLLSDVDRVGRLSSFLASAGDGVPGWTDFAAAYDMDPLVLDRILRRYLNRKRLPRFALETPVGSPAVDITRRDLPPAEIGGLLGILAIEQARSAAASDRVAVAKTLLEAATVRSPLDGDVVAARAYLAEVLGQSELAADLYRRAVYLDARQPRSHGLYASFLVRSVDESTAPAEVEAAILALDRALALSPHHRGLRALQDGLVPW